MPYCLLRPQLEDFDDLRPLRWIPRKSTATPASQIRTTDVRAAGFDQRPINLSLDIPTAKFPSQPYTHQNPIVNFEHGPLG